jgi:hypothetical protein
MVREHRRLQIVPTGWSFLAIAVVALLIIPAAAMADPTTAAPSQLIPYEEIAPLLQQIESDSNRVQVDVIGQSAGGNDLFLVTVSDPQSLGRFGRYQALRHLMLKDPERAQELIDQFEDFKVAVFINASIHGTEPEGVDAAIELIRTLAYDDTDEVRAILDNVILLVNVVANPDGRILNQRSNVNGFDLNRDFITQSQPETEATVSALTQWNPMVLLDLHGYYNPMLIEPCTPPHNPNYEYDIFIKWALDQAEAMEAELLAQTGFPAQIPYRDTEDGWDDWAPIFTPMYAMYHGAYAYTLETSYHGERGVAAHYAAAWGALKFVTENRKEMIRDQIEIFRRGFLDLDQVPISDELLAETPYDQYNELTTIEFPAAYIIPAGAPLQQNPHQAARLVDFLLFNDVQVEQASQPFALQGVDYPGGTYVVWMDQPKRGLANTILWDGWDISYDPGLDMYDISSWSHPHLWGVTRAIMEDEYGVEIATSLVKSADRPEGEVVGLGDPAAFAYLPTSNEAILATNSLLDQGEALSRAAQPFVDSDHAFGTGTFVLPVDEGGDLALADELARRYGLEVFGLDEMPEHIYTMRQPLLAVLADEGTTWFLDAFGFDFHAISTAGINGGLDLSAYDLLLIQSGLGEGLSQGGTAALESFFDGGGDYIGIGRAGADGSILFDLTPGLQYGSGSGNGIVRVTYHPDDPISAQYPEESYAFVYHPTFFTNTGGLQVSASMRTEGFFVSGYWSGWESSGAAGQPVVLHGSSGSSTVTLIGIDPTFRAHPEHTFRILANAIYSSLD